MNPEKGRKAITDYQIIEKYHTSNNEPLASLVRCKLYTGRTHQIRVHLDHIGNPVVCDKKYGKGFVTKTKIMSDNSRTQLLNLDRHALHSSKISFLHPSNNEIMTFEAALPLDRNSFQKTQSLAGCDGRHPVVIGCFLQTLLGACEGQSVRR